MQRSQVVNIGHLLAGRRTVHNYTTIFIILSDFRTAVGDITLHPSCSDTILLCKCLSWSGEGVHINGIFVAVRRLFYSWRRPHSHYSTLYLLYTYREVNISSRTVQYTLRSCRSGGAHAIVVRTSVLQFRAQLDVTRLAFIPTRINGCMCMSPLFYSHSTDGNLTECMPTSTVTSEDIGGGGLQLGEYSVNFALVTVEP